MYMKTKDGMTKCLAKKQKFAEIEAHWSDVLGRRSGRMQENSLIGRAGNADCANLSQAAEELLAAGLPRHSRVAMSYLVTRQGRRCVASLRAAKAPVTGSPEKLLKTQHRRAETQLQGRAALGLGRTLFGPTEAGDMFAKKTSDLVLRKEGGSLSPTECLR